MLDKELYDVLNAVTLKKMATAAVVAEVTGYDVDRCRGAITELSERGLVAAVGTSALPTDASGQVLVDSAAAIYGSARDDATVLQVADKFEDVNSRFLQAMSSWQQVDAGGRKLINDHTDSEYDQKVIAKIDRLVSRLAGLLEALAEKDSRFRTYVGRFERALARVESGDISFVSDPTKDSVHNVWFEFHEDLLRTLGRARKE